MPKHTRILAAQISERAEESIVFAAQVRRPRHGTQSTRRPELAMAKFAIRARSDISVPHTSASEGRCRNKGDIR